MAVRSFRQEEISMVSERQQLGQSGHWTKLVISAAVNQSAVAEITGNLSGGFRAKERGPSAIAATRRALNCTERECA